MIIVSCNINFTAFKTEVIHQLAVLSEGFEDLKKIFHSLAVSGANLHSRPECRALSLIPLRCPEDLKKLEEELSREETFNEFVIEL